MFAAVAFVLVLAVGPFLGLRAYARRVEAMDAPIEDRLHRLDRVQQAAGLGLPALALLGVYALGLMNRATARVDAAGPDLFGIAVLEFAVIALVSFGIVAVPLVSVVLGTYPTSRTLRTTTTSAWRRISRVLAALTIGVGAAVLGLGGIIAVVSNVTVSRFGLVAALGVLVVVGFGLSPYLLVLSRTHDSLEGQRRDRVERLCERTDYSPRRVYLLDDKPTETATALVAGTLPGLRYVFLTDSLLDACDDDELQAILAHEFGHVAGRHLWQRGLLTVAVFGAWALLTQYVEFGWLVATFGTVGYFVPLIGVYVLYRVLLGWLARWQEFRADVYAAHTVGYEAMVGALETLADANDVRFETGVAPSLTTQHPPLEARIDVLRDDDTGS